ncbi:ABC transporter substrate-binding protein [Bifidobacterium crudilactis]|uniref:ABC transporter substrate-binding protein n=1 Tax=Bifidobacterium crudilactis TaxID=327277 RepID=UPI0005582BAA|nr:ABC transporter substrate-binding protein [Bifidobacterium crudilactis]
MRVAHKALTATLAIAMLAGTAACGSSSDDGDAAAGGIYYLNNKPEIADSMKALAAAYTKETGVPFTVQTAASGTYQQSLKSELSKSQPPTLFQVLGQSGLDTWKDYAANMSDTEIYKQLNDPDLALKSDDGNEVLAVPVVTETYGIIYRKDLLQKYFELPNATIKDVKDINNFEALKTVSDEIQTNASALGVKGAFASMGFDASSNWRWSTHLASIPLAFEFAKDNVTKQPSSIKGTYLKQFKNITDLYLKDSTVPTSALSGKTMDDSLSDITTGAAVFFQNGSWSWPDLVSGGLKADQIGVLPIYTGIPGEEDYGMSTGSETFWCVNKQASEESQKATKDFLKWLITSDKGRETWSHTMGFTTPFKTFTGEYATDNPIVKAADEYQAEGKKNVQWAFLYDPSDEWKTNLGNSLLEYAQGTSDWDGVKKAFVDSWATEYETTKANQG